MKPISRITILERTAFDETPIRVAGVELTALGDLTITLKRDEMGAISVEACEVTAEPGWMAQIKETELTLKELHEQLARTLMAAQHAHTDMFAIHKWLTR